MDNVSYVHSAYPSSREFDLPYCAIVRDHRKTSRPSSSDEQNSTLSRKELLKHSFTSLWFPSKAKETGFTEGVILRQLVRESLADLVVQLLHADLFLFDEIVRPTLMRSMHSWIYGKLYWG